MENRISDTRNNQKVITIALAGNPNVGKSVIFNKLTGMSQVIGNWPGKTVAKAEGYCYFAGYTFKIIDLPGIYSLSTFSIEEIITREYIVEEKPDYIINVVDANQLERNLYFTFQLQLLGRPMIMALNQYDLLQERGFEIDTDKLSNLLNMNVEKVVAVHNRGVHELLEKIIRYEENREYIQINNLTFGKKLENELSTIMQELETLIEDNIKYPPKFIALKLLEDDKQIKESLLIHDQEKWDRFLYKIIEIRHNIEKAHGEQITTIINGEFYQIAGQIISEVQSVQNQTRSSKLHIFFDHITVHSIWGYFILALTLLGSFLLIFQFGNWISGALDGWFENLTPQVIESLGGEESWLYKLLWNGLVGGLIGGIGGVLPFVIPFYLIIEILQDIGYLPRAAYLMDRFLHHLGVHGKTIIPVLLGFGCSVPAVSACRIMENEKQRRRSIIISTMIPCAATTSIVLNLVAQYLGKINAILLYLILFIIIVAIGKYLTITSDVDESELIIELHDFRKPNFSVIFSQTWRRSREFVYIALPLIVGIGILMQILVEFHFLTQINRFLSPVTVVMLGLPIGVGVYLIYGILRKELNLILLELFVTTELGLTMVEYLTPLQMMTFTIVILLYIPCLATAVTIWKETNSRFAWSLLLFRILLAIIIGWYIRIVFLGLENIFSELPFSILFIGTIIIFFFTTFGVLMIFKHFHFHHEHSIRHHRHLHHKKPRFIGHIHKKDHHRRRNQNRLEKRKIKEFARLNTCNGCSMLGKCKQTPSSCEMVENDENLNKEKNEIDEKLED